MLMLPARTAGRKSLLLAGILRSLARRPRWAHSRTTPSPCAASEAASTARGLASLPALLAGPPAATAAAAAILCSRLQAFSPLPLSASILLQKPLPAPMPSTNTAVAPSCETAPANTHAAVSEPPARHSALLGIKPAEASSKPSLSDKAALLAYAQLAC